MLAPLINQDHKNQKETQFLFFVITILVQIGTQEMQIIKYRKCDATSAYSAGVV